MAALVIAFAQILHAAAPTPLARWTFDVNANDDFGKMHGTLFGGAKIENGRLVLDGTGYVRTAPLPVDLGAKTLVARVKVSPLDQSGGSALTVQQTDGQIFDAIVYGELQSRKWMPGSDNFSRTRVPIGADAEKADDEFVHMVIVYQDDGAISMYRNGRPYGESYLSDSGLQTFAAGKSEVLLGMRHTEGASPFLTGEIEDAALYGRALTFDEISELSGQNPPSIARIWNEELLNAIRIDTPHPPVHARNLFTLSAAMYDAWAAYDPIATGFAYRGKQIVADATQARRVAISYAAYHVLVDRFKFALNADTTLAGLRQRMLSIGLDPEREVAPPESPEGVGLATAAAIIEWFLQDGSRQSEGYEDLPAREGGYESFQPALDTAAIGVPGLLDVNRWQPLVFTTVEPAGQNGSVVVSRTQPFLGSQWLGVRPFALTRPDSHLPWIDPGPPPRFGGITDAEFHSNVVTVIRASPQLSPDDGVVIDISPGSVGNNPLGENSGAGHPINPVTGQPYAPNPVLRGDFARVLAEFWADGPNSETPPGHWNVLANQASDSPGFAKRIGGTGPILEDLEWDVKLYFALNAALHDAA